MPCPQATHTGLEQDMTDLETQSSTSAANSKAELALLGMANLPRFAKPHPG
jgi:hypothetical protein